MSHNQYISGISSVFQELYKVSHSENICILLLCFTTSTGFYFYLNEFYFIGCRDTPCSRIVYRGVKLLGNVLNQASGIRMYRKSHCNGMTE